MDNTSWYAWDDMTPWRFAILIGVALVTWAVIKLVERFGASDGAAGQPDDHLGDDDIVTNPTFRHFAGNMYHRHDED
jgi:hypothetical protein